jgi:tRNA (guanine37-N1)-methyltransferase
MESAGSIDYAIMFLATVVTIFPDIFPGPLGHGLTGRSLGKSWNLRAVNIRDFAEDKHKKVDDTPYGGGAGMVIRPDVVHNALEHSLKMYEKPPKVIFMTPRGKTLSDSVVREIAGDMDSGMIVLCGRYEGIDQRVIDFWKSEHGMIEISIGDYILFGGEIPAIVLIDTCLRHLPGIIGNAQSVEDESFSLDLLEYPHYTKPMTWNGIDVPSVLLSGDHGKIAGWRTEQSVAQTVSARPDLLAKRCGT